MLNRSAVRRMRSSSVNERMRDHTSAGSAGSKSVSSRRIIRAVHLVRLMKGTEERCGKSDRWWQTFFEGVVKAGSRGRRGGGIGKTAAVWH